MLHRAGDGQAGIAPGIRLRLWFWLARATTGAELRRWLQGVPVDHSIFGAAQPIYTAAPLFCAGAADPLKERLSMVPGARHAVSVPRSSVGAASAPTAHAGDYR